MSSPFGIHQDQKVTFMIEGANFYAAARNNDIKVDYRKLLSHFNEHSNFVRANYYTGVPDDTEYASIKPLLDFLEYNGYTLVTKPLKEHIDSMGRRKVKGNLDVEIAVDMMNAAKFADHIVLFSGDADFLPVVRDVQRQGVRVTVVSTLGAISDDLRRACDKFVDIKDEAVMAIIAPDVRDRDPTDPRRSFPGSEATPLSRPAPRTPGTVIARKSISPA